MQLERVQSTLIVAGLRGQRLDRVPNRVIHGAHLIQRMPRHRLLLLHRLRVNLNLRKGRPIRNLNVGALARHTRVIPRMH